MALYIVLLILTVSIVSAVEFKPTIMKFSVANIIQYDFDGTTLKIPVTVSGTPASAYFLVFTKDQAATISKVNNGFLGWHFVNNIDTCLYLSGEMSLGVGSNEIVWDGKNSDKKMVPSGEYTYYLWGFDNTHLKIPVAHKVSVGAGNTATDGIYTLDNDGNPLVHPEIYAGGHRTGMGAARTARSYYKWVIGNDPEDSLLIETTSAEVWANNSPMCLLPKDRSFWFALS